MKIKERIVEWSEAHRSRQMVLLIEAVLTALALTVTFYTPDPQNEGIDLAAYAYLYKLLTQFADWLTDKGFLLTVLTLGFYLLYRMVWSRKKERVRFGRILSAVLAILYTGGKAFQCADSLSALYSPIFNLFKTGILLCGFYFLYSALLHLLYVILHTHKDINPKSGLMLKWYRRHPFLCPWWSIFLLWIPHLIMRYPGAMSYDNYNQLAYYLGYEPFSTAQPVFHTWLFGTFIHLGSLVGSDNMGLFLFVLFQSLIMSAVLAYSLFLMRRWKTPVWLRALTMGIYCTAPYYAGYAAFPIKDFLYTACFLLLVLEVMEAVRGEEDFWRNGVHNLLWITSACFMILFRKNGLFIYLPLMLVCLFCGIIKEICRKGMNWHMAVVLLAPLVLAAGTEGVISTRYHVIKDSPKEMLSLPFQQTARYVRDYGDEVTAEEREAISAVLDYEQLPDLYLEFSADPVKTTYHAQSTKELADYLKTWAVQFLKHPLCYLEATWNQNYYLFMPDIDHIVYNKDYHAGEEIFFGTQMEQEIRFHIPDKMQGLASIAVSLYTLLSRLPVIGMLNNVAFYVIGMFAVLLFMVHDRAGKRMVVMLPLLVSFLFLILGPQIYNQPRYAFPIIYSMPAVTGFYMWMEKGRKQKGF